MTHIKVEPEEPASLQHALSQCAPKAEVVPNQKEPELSLAALEALSNDADVSKLEKAIEVGHGVLDDIKKAFATAAKAPEISSWIQSAEKLQAQAKMSRAVIGVVGVTGAGKSSIINAVLDEECLVPTNCMRACTAVITEIAYNHDSDEKIPYRAEIHFIKEDEWTAELQIMLDELAQANGIVGPEDTEAGIAYSKVRSVYPHLQLKDLTKGKYTAQGLANNPNSKAFLGTVIEISASTVDSFHQQLKQYIDSKDKNSKENGVMEYWPLIKVVKLFIKCSVLESGLVLVDLPGTQDNNAARSSVAAKYLEECTRLWVVAPIHRAVNDKTAHDLLGRAFRRQLQLDSKLSNVSFVCSKTDDAPIEELLRIIPHDEEAQKLQRQLEATRSKLDQLWNVYEPLEGSISSMSAAIEELDKEKDSVEKAIRKARKNGGPVILGSQQKKRKPNVKPTLPRKRRRTDFLNQSDEEDEVPSDGITAAADEPRDGTLSIEDACARVDSLAAEKNELREKRNKAQLQYARIGEEINQVEQDAKDLTKAVHAACVSYRNDYSRPTIQTQFAAGIRELDQEAAIRRDEASFDPDHEERDYQAVAASLPVFCVSSRAYQTLTNKAGGNSSAKRRKPKPIVGFETPESTGIPALRQHGTSFVHDIRSASGQSFLKGLAQFLTSLYLQIAIAEQPVPMTDETREEELRFLEDAMTQVKAGIASEIGASFKKIKNDIVGSLDKNLHTATLIASDKAVPTVAGWSRPKEDGGLLFATFRAVCRRGGKFERAKNGTIDFNQDLTDPMLVHVASLWEKTFSRLIPNTLNHLGAALDRQVQTFIVLLKKRPQLRTARGFSIVAEQLEKFGGQLKNMEFANQYIATGQQESNRLFVRTVSVGMNSAYKECANIRGAGSFLKMKQHLDEYIEEQRDSIFKKTRKRVHGSLTKMMELLREHLEVRVEEIVEQVRIDTESLAANKNAFEAFGAIQESIRALLHDVDGGFQKALSPSEIARAQTQAELAEKAVEVAGASGIAHGHLDAAPVVPSAAAKVISSIEATPATVTPGVEAEVHQQAAPSTTLEDSSMKGV